MNNIPATLILLKASNGRPGAQWNLSGSGHCTQVSQVRFTGGFQPSGHRQRDPADLHLRRRGEKLQVVRILGERLCQTGPVRYQAAQILILTRTRGGQPGRPGPHDQNVNVFSLLQGHTSLMFNGLRHDHFSGAADCRLPGGNDEHSR